MYQEFKTRLPFGHRKTFWDEVKKKNFISRRLELRSPIARRHTILEEIDASWALTFVGGLGIGMGLMFLFDPARGSHRRAKIKDACLQSMHAAGDAIGAISSRVTSEERMGNRLDVH